MGLESSPLKFMFLVLIRVVRTLIQSSASTLSGLALAGISPTRAANGSLKPSP